MSLARGRSGSDLRPILSTTGLDAIGSKIFQNGRLPRSQRGSTHRYHCARAAGLALRRCAAPEQAMWAPRPARRPHVDRRLGVHDGMGADVGARDHGDQKERREHQERAIRPDLWHGGTLLQIRFMRATSSTGTFLTSALEILFTTASHEVVLSTGKAVCDGSKAYGHGSEPSAGRREKAICSTFRFVQLRCGSGTWYSLTLGLTCFT